MNRVTVCFTAFAVAILLGGLAQPVSAQSDEATVELRRLARAVERLVELTEQMARSQETDQLLRRLELKVRQVDPLERELRQKQESLDDSQVYLQMAFDELETQREQLRDLETDPNPTDETRGTATQIQENLKYQEKALAQQEDMVYRLQQRVAELENQLSAPRAELRTLEAALSERLNL